MNPSNSIDFQQLRAFQLPQSKKGHHPHHDHHHHGRSAGRHAQQGVGVAFDRSSSNSLSLGTQGLRSIVNELSGASRSNETLFSYSESVNVQISSKGMQLSYQSSSSFSSFSPAFVEETQEVARPEPANAAQSPQTSADNILGFIEDRLKTLSAEGATTEELESTLDQGLAGFIKGRDEAIDILKGYGFFEGPTEEGVAKTTELVTAGVDALREKYIGGGEPAGSVEAAPPTASDDVVAEVVVAAAPVPDVVEVAAPVPVVTSSADDDDEPSGSGSDLLGGLNYQPRFGGQTSGAVASYRESLYAEETIDLQVTTLDGDIVTLSLEAIQGYEGQAGAGAFYQQGSDGGEIGVVTNLDAYVFGESNFNIAVDGDLDKGEIKALNKLFSQVGKLADTFFNGDIAKAFKKAQNLNLDSRELMSMSLDMTQTKIVSVSSAYEGVAGLGGGGRGQGHHGHGGGHHGQSLQGLGNYMQELMDSLQTASQFSQPKDLLKDLFAAYLADLETKSKEEIPVDAEQLERINGEILDSLA